MKKKRKKVFAAMSGGVDSSVATLLLKERGYDVVGVFMRCWHPNSAPSAFDLRQSESAHPNDCPAERDAEDARRVAERLGIPFYVWDFEEEYKKRVVEYMVDGYRRGLTPNPDVMCNKEIKFGLFLEKALAMGADYVTTGHYVRLRRNNTNLRMSSNATNKEKSIRGIRQKFVSFALYDAKDQNKDQSYFLWTLVQKQLKHCLFPIGDYLKSEVREIARKAGLPTADKKDSQGICFLGKVTLTDFLKTYIPEKRGEVLTASGDKVGEHSGAHFYTIGQRHLGVNFQFSRKNFQAAQDNRQPFYVANKNISMNTVFVAEGSDNPALYKKEIELDDVNFISRACLPAGRNKRIRVMMRVRYRQPLAPATLIFGISDSQRFAPNSKSFTTFRLIFDKPQKFVAPGQSAVFYEMSPSTSSGLKMLGGGVIL